LHGLYHHDNTVIQIKHNKERVKAMKGAQQTQASVTFNAARQDDEAPTVVVASNAAEYEGLRRFLSDTTGKTGQKVVLRLATPAPSGCGC
jgi:hypothetical protein